MSGPWGREAGGGPRNSESLLGAKDRIGDAKTGWSRGGLGRFRDDTVATSREVSDLRNDVDISSAVLEAKYAAEFAAAETRIKERQESWSEKMRLKIGYDYEADRAYNYWQQEARERAEFLKIHWIDEWLDDARMQVQYGMRIFTTIGLLHGAYRTHVLWKTIDRNYAKLHGVGLGSIAAENVSWSVLKGAAVGIACGIGTLVGDNSSRVIECLVTDTIYRPQRNWKHVTFACLAGGLCSSVMSVAVNWKTFKPFGHALVGGTIMAASGLLGLYMGPYVYRPYRVLHPKPYDETPRPWHEKEFQKTGPTGVRGRWM